MVTGWADNDLDGALAYVQSMPKGKERSSLAMALVNNLTEQDPSRALAFIQLEKTDANSANSSLRSLFAMWGRTDPQSAAQKLMTLPATQRDYVMRYFVSAWAKDAPEAALAFVQSLPNSNGKRYAFTAALGELALTNPELAAQESLKVSAAYRRDVVGAVVSNWAEKDLNGARNFVHSLTEGPVKQRALTNLGNKWAQTDPLGAADFALQLPNGSTRNGLIRSVASVWSQSDPLGAMQWANGLPDNSTKSSSMQAIVTNMASRDPANAAKWIEQIPSSVLGVK